MTTAQDKEIGAPSTFEKTTLNVSVSLDIDHELTWGELFWFVEQAKAAGVNPGSDVPVTETDNPSVLARLYTYIDPTV